MTDRTWMVRAGRGGRYFERFRDGPFVAIGWARVGNLAQISTRDEVAEMVRAAYPDFKDQAVFTAAGQLYRFAREFREGDNVITYDPAARRYLRGKVIGPYAFHPEETDEELLNQRPTLWEGEVPRDRLSAGARNILGSTLTIFSVPPAVYRELWEDRPLDAAPQSQPNEELLVNGLAPSELTEEQIAAQASEAIKDRIALLSWQEMQELVAGLLRAMGYKTTVSPPGSDRGKDIIASPDGLGFQEPRIVVEVKHRINERMGSQEIRSFLGGRHANDKGLFVSTGGFSREAYYEAERASILLTLMDFERLVEEILARYQDFDEETKQLLPLRRFYWPIK